MAGDPSLPAHPTVPGPLLAVGDHVHPTLSTSPDDVLPDIGPRMGQARDGGLDALAQGTTNVRAPSPDAGVSPGEEDAAAALDASIADARAARPATEADELPTLPPPHDPLLDLTPRR